MFINEGWDSFKFSLVCFLEVHQPLVKYCALVHNSCTNKLRRFNAGKKLTFVNHAKFLDFMSPESSVILLPIWGRSSKKQGLYRSITVIGNMCLFQSLKTFIVPILEKT